VGGAIPSKGAPISISTLPGGRVSERWCAREYLQAPLCVRLCVCGTHASTHTHLYKKTNTSARVHKRTRTHGVRVHMACASSQHALSSHTHAHLQNGRRAHAPGTRARSTHIHKHTWPGT